MKHILVDLNFQFCFPFESHLVLASQNEQDKGEFIDANFDIMSESEPEVYDDILEKFSSFPKGKKLKIISLEETLINMTLYTHFCSQDVKNEAPRVREELNLNQIKE
jgi:hypothetical protein